MAHLQTPLLEAGDRLPIAAIRKPVYLGSMKRRASRVVGPFVVVAIASCAPPAQRLTALSVIRQPEAYYGKRVELCGDLAVGEHRGFKNDKFYPGFFLFSAGGKGTFMHGREGLFLPRRDWLTQYVGRPVCVTGSISHYTGMTPQQLAKVPGREVTDSAVDAQWHFDVTKVALAGKSPR